MNPAAPALPARRLLLSTVVACGLATLGAKDAPPPVFEPDLERAGGLVLQGATWTHDDESFTIHVRELSQDERLGYIERSTGFRVDPFAAPPGQPPRYLSYLLVIENKGETPVGFNALDCWLRSNQQKIQTPLGLTDLSFDYHIAGRELPAAYEKISPLMLEGARTILPGESISGLLIYHVLDPKTKRYDIAVDLILPSGDTATVAAPYRRVKPDKDDR